MRLGLGLGLGGAQTPRKAKVETKYLFIDGGCLRATLKNVSDRYFNGMQIRIDYNRLRGSHAKAFYYDAIPAIREKENEEQYYVRTKERRDLHNHIASLPGYHVYEGDSRIRRKQVQQKEVDVMIAVDMLTHTFRGNMQSATFLASDLDFKPLLDALVREGMFVELLYPTSETNQNLIDSADRRTPLAIDTIYGYLDRKSQSLVQIPRRGQERKDDFHPESVLVISDQGGLGSINYFKNGDGHNLYWDYPENIDNYLRVNCNNYEVLRKYVEDLYLVMIPEDPPII